MDEQNQTEPPDGAAELIAIRDSVSTIEQTTQTKIPRLNDIRRNPTRLQSLISNGNFIFDASDSHSLAWGLNQIQLQEQNRITEDDCLQMLQGYLVGLEKLDSEVEGKMRERTPLYEYYWMLRIWIGVIHKETMAVVNGPFIGS